MSSKKFRGLRGGKFSHYEGGHRVAAVAWWPGKIKPSTASEAFVLGFDLVPIFTDITGISGETRWGEREGSHLPAEGFFRPGYLFGCEPKLGKRCAEATAS